MTSRSRFKLLIDRCEVCSFASHYKPQRGPLVYLRCCVNYTGYVASDQERWVQEDLEGSGFILLLRQKSRNFLGQVEPNRPRYHLPDFTLSKCVSQYSTLVVLWGR